MNKRIRADEFFEALLAADVFRDGESIRRVVIDALAGHVVVIHVERFGDERLLKVVQTLSGVEITETPAKPVAESEAAAVQ